MLAHTPESNALLRKQRCTGQEVLPPHGVVSASARAQSLEKSARFAGQKKRPAGLD